MQAIRQPSRLGHDFDGKPTRTMVPLYTWTKISLNLVHVSWTTIPSGPPPPLEIAPLGRPSIAGEFLDAVRCSAKSGGGHQASECRVPLTRGSCPLRCHSDVTPGLLSAPVSLGCHTGPGARDDYVLRVLGGGVNCSPPHRVAGRSAVVLLREWGDDQQ